MHQASVIVTPERTRRVWLPHGKKGNVAYMLRMAETVREAVNYSHTPNSERLSEIADKILWERDVQGHDELTTLDAVHDFVILNVRYIKDPAALSERLQHPLVTLKRGYGDCDDLVILEASLLAMLGFGDLEFEAARYEETEDGGYQHVYLRAGVPAEVSASGYVYLDPTNDVAPLGWYEKDHLEAVRLPVLDENPGLEIAGLSGAWDTLINQGINAGLQIGANAYNQAKLNSQQTRQAGQQFEQLAGQVTQIMVSIRQQATVTQSDYAKALQAYQALQAFVSQYPIPYITNQWNSEDYDAAYRHHLEEIAKRVQGGAQLADAGGNVVDMQGNPVYVVPASDDTNTLLKYAAVAVGGGLLFKMLLGGK